jgi:hypothetical protein
MYPGADSLQGTDASIGLQRLEQVGQVQRVESDLDRLLDTEIDQGPAHPGAARALLARAQREPAALEAQRQAESADSVPLDYEVWTTLQIQRPAGREGRSRLPFEPADTYEVGYDVPGTALDKASGQSPGRLHADAQCPRRHRRLHAAHRVLEHDTTGRRDAQLVRRQGVALRVWLAPAYVGGGDDHAEQPLKVQLAGHRLYLPRLAAGH